MPTLTLEDQLRDLRTEITRAETEGAGLKAEADEQRDALASRNDGKSLLNLGDKTFDEMDAKYRAADEKIQEALDLRHRETRLLEIAARDNGGVPGSPKGDGRPLNRQERRAFTQIAKRYLDSEQFDRLKKSGALTSNSRIRDDFVEVLERGGYDPESGSLRSELIEGLRTRTTVNIGDAGAVIPIDQQVWPPVQIPVRQVQLLDLVSMSTTDSDVVNWVKQTVRADFAAETPYGTVAPEADYEFALQQVGVKRIPTFIPATRDILADQGQLQPLLQDQLMVGVRLRLEAQALSGSGTSFSDTNIQGMLNASGIGTVTYQSSGHSSEYQLDAYHRAITTIRLTLFADPKHAVVSPVDYEWAVLKRDLYGRYLFDPNSEADFRSLWGLETVISPVISQGTALVGDFKQAYRIWIREGLSVTASTEHLDFFTRGMVAILAQLRVAAATLQPRALCQVLGLTGP